MKKIYLNIEDKVFKQALCNLFEVFGFSLCNTKNADFVLDDLGDKICVNGDKIFEKPIDIFHLVSEMSKMKNLNVSGLELYEKSRKILFDGEEISLTDIEVKILSVLMEKTDGILSSDLCEKVFSKVNESCLKSLATHIYNLKKKIEKLTKKQKNIILENSRYFLDL